MNFMFVVSAVFLVISYETVFASPTGKFTNATSIVNYLKNQSRMAQDNFSSFSPKQLNVGNQVIKAIKQGGNSPRITNDAINLIFHQNGSITYAVNGTRKTLLSVRSGEFQIDPDIFNLVFPGYSMDNKQGTTDKNMEELKQTTTTTTTIKPTTQKNNPPKKGTKSSANFKTYSSFITILLFCICHL